MARRLHIPAAVDGAGRNAGHSHETAKDFFNTVDLGRPRTFAELPNWRLRFAAVSDCPVAVVDSIAHLIPRAAAKMFPGRELMDLFETELR